MGVEETLTFFKPDGMINTHAQQAFNDYLRIYGLEIWDERQVKPTRKLMEDHYKDLKGRLPDHVIEEILGYVTATGHAFEDYHAHLLRTFPEDGITSFPGHLQAYHVIGDDAVRKVREFLGPTNPGKTCDDRGEPLSLGLRLRPQFGSTHGGGIYNIAHATDKPENAPGELERFGFTPLYTRNG